MTTQMHAARVARAKSAQNLQRTWRIAARPQGSHSSAAGNSTTARHSDLIIKHALGEFPPYNDHVKFIQDHYNNKMYLVGGISPKDKGNDNPTSDFYSCDMENMRWTNLTVSLELQFFSLKIGT
jgi:hypothetical protein